MTRGTICQGCGGRIEPEDVAIHFPDYCNKDVGSVGWFHRDCGLFHEIGEDGLLFEENVQRIFAVFHNVLADWCDPDNAERDMLPQIIKAADTLRTEMKDYFAVRDGLDEQRLEVQ